MEQFVSRIISDLASYLISLENFSFSVPHYIRHTSLNIHGSSKLLILSELKPNYGIVSNALIPISKATRKGHLNLTSNTTKVSQTTT